MYNENLNFYFYLRNSKAKKNGLAPIYVRLKSNGHRHDFSTRLFVFEQDWNNDFKRVNPKSENAQKINSELDDFVERIKSIVNSLSTLKQTYSLEELALRVKGEYHESFDLFELFEDHNKDMNRLVGIEYKPATIEKFVRTLKKLRAFVKTEYGRNTFAIHEVNKRFIEKFQIYLRNVDSCSYNTSIRYLEFFKKIILNARDNNLINQNPFASKKLTRKKVEKVNLTQEEVDTIQKLEIDFNRLERVRDAFIFQCYTGLAYTDLKQLTMHNIQTIEGVRFIVKEREKTEITSYIPLFPEVELLIKKYTKTKDRKIQNLVLLEQPPINRTLFQK